MEELYPSKIQSRCKVGYVTSLEIKKLVNEQVKSTLQELKEELEGMKLKLIYSYWNEGFNEALDAVLSLLEKRIK